MTGNTPSYAATALRLAVAGGKHLEGKLLYPAAGGRETGVVICPPHPLLAGNMDNNVVQAVAARLAASMPVLLFNYQAVGTSYKPRPVPLFEHWQALDSCGDFSEIFAEAKDVVTAGRRFFQRCAVVGYSFGALVAAHCLPEDGPGLVLIAPPAAEHPFPPLSTGLPLLVIDAAQDDLTGSGRALPYPQARHETITGADHYFIGHEEEVATLAAAFLIDK